jgi:TPR repeat protein
VALLIEKANRGDVEAQFTLGELFSKERVGFYMSDLQPDCVEAMKWYRLAATNGHPKAPFMLARWLEAGCAEITSDTIKQADAEDKRFAARIGANPAELDGLNDVMPRKTRRGFAPDLKEAEYWYRVAAEKDDEEARERAARFFSRTKKDKAEAYYWMLRAIQVQTNRQPNDYNQQVTTDLEEQLTQDQITNIRQRAEAAAKSERRHP